MAELGVIASIIGIAGLGVKLSKTLFEIGEKAVSAEKNVHRLATNVALFAQTLKHFAEVMRVNQDLYSDEFEATAQQIRAECQSIFTDLTQRAVMTRAKPPPDQKKRFFLIKRVQMYFEQSKVDWLISQLEYLKTTLSLLIQTLQLAAVTAKAKQNTAKELARENEEAVEREKIHIETLIIARQLSFLVVLQQHNYHQADTTTKTGHAVEIEDEPAGNVSPIESDEPVEEVFHQKLLTEGPSESNSLVKLGRGNLKFLDDAIDYDEPDNAPVMKPSHAQIIDQLLERWTRLPELELTLKPNQTNPQPLKREMTMSDFTAPLDNNSPPAYRPNSETVALPYLGTSHDQNTKSESGISKARPPPPPLVTHTTDPVLPSTMNKMNPDNQSLHRAVTTPDPEGVASRTQQIQPMSPKLNNLNMAPPYTPPPQHASPSKTVTSLDRSLSSFSTSPNKTFTSASANPQFGPRPGSSHQSGPTPRNLYNSPVSPRQPSYRSSSDSDLDEDGVSRRLSLGIPWRIVIGNRYWDFRDERLVGPREPHLPTEKMSYLYSHDSAETEIALKWVCEEALAEKNYPYLHLPSDGHYDARWRVQNALKFDEVDGLVERTIEIFRRKQNTLSRDGSSRAQPIAASAGYGQAQAQAPSAPQQYMNNGGIPGAQQPVQDPARARAENFNTWQQMNNSQQARTQQQPRGYQGQDPTWIPPPPPVSQQQQALAPVPRGVHFTPSVISNAPSSTVGTARGSNYSSAPTPAPVYGNAAPASQTGGSRSYDPEPKYSRDLRYESETSDYDKSHRRRSKDKKKRKSYTAAKVSGLMAVLDSLDAF